MSNKKSSAVLRVGDYVSIPRTTYPPGRIVESRGPLGPGGAQIYRVRIPERPKPIYIELREDQLELRHMVTTITFSQLSHKLRSPSSRGRPKRLTYPEPVVPFVPQTATAEEFPVEQSPLASDVLLFTAPAAVGKSTYARALAAAAQIPLLDLAKIKVSTGALSGILEEIGDRASQEFQNGNFSLIIDALDEGRIFSGSSHIEEFFRTTLERLDDPGAPKGQGPKLLVFGRPNSIGEVAALLELEAPSLPVTRLTLDYFDKAAATELVLAFARKIGSPEKVERYITPIKAIIHAFFGAISSAIGIDAEKLWDHPHGRSFAGYAPVLAALGTLIVKDKKDEGDERERTNFEALLQRLRDTGPIDAWQVLENVANEILDREARKVREPLLREFGSDVPVEAYDRTNQLDVLAAHFAGESVLPSSQLSFGSPAASQAYRKAVEVHWPEHPFLHDKAPVNDVLGALVIAHAISKGKKLSGGQGPKLLAEYGRQPFLWRFFRHRVPDRTSVDGGVVAFVLGSLWSDDTATRADTTFCPIGPDSASLVIKAGDSDVTVKVVLPVSLRGEVRNVVVDLVDGDVVLSSWPGSDTSSIAFLGRAIIRAGTITFEVKQIHVGALGVSASCHLEAKNPVNDQQMAPPEVHPGSELTIQGAFENRYPWHSVATVARPSVGGDPLGKLLVDCEQRIQGVMSLVTFPNFDLTNDERVDWAQKYGQLLPRLLRALVDAGLAKTHVIQTKEDTKMRVSPSVRWSQLRQAYERPAQADPRLRQLLEELR